MFNMHFFYYLHRELKLTIKFYPIIFLFEVNYSFNFNTFDIPFWMSLSGSFIVALIITWISIPTIVKISRFKQLNATLNERTSHLDDTPNLGGLAVFAGFTLAAIIFSLKPESTSIKFLLGGLVVLFAIGIKDDILVIDPRKKFLGQIIASLIAVWIGGIRVTNLHQAMGIGEISPLLSIIFTLFLFLLLINGFNLIDGIDGLASGLGFMVSSVYGIWFILTGHMTYGVLSLALAGSLTAFFRFNVLSKVNKIFLGDTGSMLTGFVIAFLTIQFLEYGLNAPEKYQFNSAPSIAVGLLIVPLFDMLRVFVLRICNGKSPFKADRNHIHHCLLKLGLSHLSVTIILISVSLLFTLIAVLIQNTGTVRLIIILMLLATLLSFIPGLILRYRTKK